MTSSQPQSLGPEVERDRPVVAAQEAEWFAPVHIDGPVMEAAWRRLMARS